MCIQFKCLYIFKFPRKEKKICTFGEKKSEFSQLSPTNLNFGQVETEIARVDAYQG